MNKRHILLVPTVLMGVSLFCGCQPAQAPQASGSKPAHTVSLYEAASSLGLTVHKQDYPYIEMSGTNNRVLLFLYERGRVYVNGTPIGPVGKVEQVSGTYYISELLVPKIKAALAPEISIGAAPAPTPSLPPGKLRSGTIVVDAGHGGQDPGTTSVLGTPEKGINLKIAHKLADILRKSGYRVVMTREGDSSMDKEERAAFTNRVNPDLFVSVHCDSNGNSSHRGFSVYVARQPSWTSTKIARQIESSLASAGIPSKGLRYGDYVVLVQTRCPAVLVECGFMSNYDEARNLTNSWYQQKIAQGIANGILQSL